MIISTKIQPCNLHVVPRPLTLPAIFLAPLLHLHPHRVHSASPAHHFMGNRWGNSGNSVRLYFWGLQNHCIWWLQPWNNRCLLLGRKAISNLDSILKSRDITLLTKVCLVKAMVFPVVMYGCEKWTIKKAERRRIDTFVGEDSSESLQRDETSQT